MLKKNNPKPSVFLLTRILIVQIFHIYVLTQSITFEFHLHKKNLLVLSALNLYKCIINVDSKLETNEV